MSEESKTPPPETHVRVTMADEKPDAPVERRPDWIWYCESTAGVPVVTFGRWPKHPQQARYKLADVQPTEHDHPTPQSQLEEANHLLEPAPEEEAEICEACGEPFEDGDMVYWMADDTGHIHADCCGPERESYVGPDGEPLKDGEPIPEPFVYRDPSATTEGSTHA